MGSMMETVDLALDEESELLFKVKVEGAGPSPAKVRLICEDDDVAYMFSGQLTTEPDVVQFVLPPMKDKIKEGSYLSRVEVLVDSKHFTPVTFNINFKKAVSVVAEAVRAQPRRASSDVKVTASPVSKAGSATFRTLRERYDSRR